MGHHAQLSVLMHVHRGAHHVSTHVDSTVGIVLVDVPLDVLKLAISSAT